GAAGHPTGLLNIQRLLISDRPPSPCDVRPKTVSCVPKPLSWRLPTCGGDHGPEQLRPGPASCCSVSLLGGALVRLAFASAGTAERGSPVLRATHDDDIPRHA